LGKAGVDADNGNDNPASQKAANPAAQNEREAEEEFGVHIH
jgi:hypothetical protein